MIPIRRFLLFFLWSFTFGGFLFYAGIVVPLGSSVVGVTTQGFVTRLVTDVLNASTAVTLLVLLWEAYAGRSRRGPMVNRILLVMTVVITVCCICLSTLHARLDALLDPTELAVNDSEHFYGLHRIYLWISTMQWLCSLPILWILVNCDRGQPLGRSPPLGKGSRGEKS